MSATRLWYTGPASEWKNGLPVGTGRLAGMVLGDPQSERVGLNHEWLWRGVHRGREPEKTAHLLPEVRELLLSGRYDEGTRLGNEAFAGLGGVKANAEPHQVDPYQPAGDLRFRLEHGAVQDYRRELDLETGIVTVSYAAGGVHYRREYLAHLAYDLLLVRLSADRPFSGLAWLERVPDAGCFLVCGADSDRVYLEGLFEGGIGFRVETVVRVESETGRVARLRPDAPPQNGGRQNLLAFVDAREVILAVNIGTSAQGEAPVHECARYALPNEAWEDMLAMHVAAYTELYGKLRLDLDVPASEQPTDMRVAAARAGEPDPALPWLYFNYGRYLLLASTGQLPPNLQGKWNEDLRPPWECDYHHDVNLQMAYWPAEAGNLAPTTDALFAHIERFVPHARKAARDLYGCDGVYFPLQTDVWGRCTPESYGWAVWIGAAPWLAQHLWWRWEYGQDLDFLRERAYPFLKEVAAFYESYLVPDANGRLQIVPSQSPENRFAGGGDLPVSLGVSATMDILLARELLRNAASAAELLGVDVEKQQQWREMLERLEPLKIGRFGQLQEWSSDLEELEPGHRHFSHLYGVYPGDELDPERTPELWAAARASLERRLGHKGGHTGWSRSWVACFYARFGEAAQAWEHLVHLIGDFATDSLLDLHPPRIFQIDGNLGGTAAVLEMLLQSYHAELQFLPALPSAWHTGRVRGLCARGGFTVDLEWADGCLLRGQIVALNDRECTVLHGGTRFVVSAADGSAVATEVDARRLRFPVRAGQTYTLVAQTV